MAKFGMLETQQIILIHRNHQRKHLPFLLREDYPFLWPLTDDRKNTKNELFYMDFLKLCKL